MKNAKRAKEILEDDQREVLKIGRKLRELEEETVLGVNVEKILMVY